MESTKLVEDDVYCGHCQLAGNLPQSITQQPEDIVFKNVMSLTGDSSMSLPTGQLSCKSKARMNSEFRKGSMLYKV